MLYYGGFSEIMYDDTLPAHEKVARCTELVNGRAKSYRKLARDDGDIKPDGRWKNAAAREGYEQYLGDLKDDWLEAFRLILTAERRKDNGRENRRKCNQRP